MKSCSIVLESGVIADDMDRQRGIEVTLGLTNIRVP